MKAVTKFIALVLIGMFLGGFIGAIFASRTSTMVRSSRLLASWAAVGMFGGWASLEVHEANPNQAMTAVTGYLDFMNKVQDSSNAVTDKSFYHDLALAHMQMAFLKEEGGDKGGYHEHLLLAQKALEASGRTKPSEEDLRRLEQAWEDSWGGLERGSHR